MIFHSHGENHFWNDQGRQNRDRLLLPEIPIPRINLHQKRNNPPTLMIKNLVVNGIT